MNQAQAHRMVVCNTFASAWHDPPDYRFTWQGNLFGVHRKGHLDDLLLDQHSCAKDGVGAIVRLPPRGFPSDHFGLTFQLRSLVTLHQRSPPKRFVGWAPKDPEQYDSSLHNMSEDLGPRAMSDLSASLLGVAARMPRTPRPKTVLQAACTPRTMHCAAA